MHCKEEHTFVFWEVTTSISPKEKPYNAFLIGMLFVKHKDGMAHSNIFVHESKGQSFHPKCWHFQSSKEARAYVGSSNLSFTALCRGVEWNLAVSQSDQPLVYERLKHSIDHLCSSAHPLTQKWVDRYIEEAEQQPNAPLPPGEMEDEDQNIIPMPIQLQALEALKKSRNDGRKRALIVMATGLGKTYVSIFDTLHVQAKKIFFSPSQRAIISSIQ